VAALRQLAAFDAVAAELHFGRAAERLGIGQPAVSQLVRRLEEEHGVVVFERSSHHVALTAAGADLLASARRALAAGRAFDDAARAIAAGTRGVLRIATSDATTGSLAFLVRRFAAAHPEVHVDLQALESDAKAPSLLAGAVDLAFVRAPVRARGVRRESLWTEPLVAVVPSSVARTSGPAAADPTVLARVPLMIIARSAHPAMHDELVAECRVAGFEPRLGPPLASPREGLAAIAAGAGWTLTPRSNAPRAIEGVTVLHFAVPQPTTTVSLMWRATGANVHALAFVALAQAAAAAHDLPA